MEVGLGTFAPQFGQNAESSDRGSPHETQNMLTIFLPGTQTKPTALAMFVSKKGTCTVAIVDKAARRGRIGRYLLLRLAPGYYRMPFVAEIESPQRRGRPKRPSPMITLPSKDALRVVVTTRLALLAGALVARVATLAMVSRTAAAAPTARHGPHGRDGCRDRDGPCARQKPAGASGLVDAVKADLALLVDLEDLDLDLVTDVEHVLDLVDATLRDAGDVEQTVLAGKKLDEGTEGLDADDATGLYSSPHLGGP